MGALVSAVELGRRLQEPQIRVLDVQFALGGPAGLDLYVAGHLPRAVFLDLETALAGPPGPRGRHPLPDPRMTQEALRAAGVNSDSHIVVYDQATSLSAARAWWILRWLGLSSVQVLDGGLAAWRAAGGAVTVEPTPIPPRGTVSVRPGSLPVLDAEAAAALAEQGRLLDSRASERFAGLTEPIDTVAGHIPGSLNTPMSDYQHPDGRLLDPDLLRAYFAGRAVPLDPADPVPLGTSCGSGVTACHTALALHEIGVDATPYIGSWSEWIRDPTRPVATS